MFRRTVSVSATLVAFVALGAASSAAQSQAQSQAPSQAAPPAAVATPAEHPLAYPMRLRLNDLEAAAETQAEKDLVTGLASAYAARGFAPVWLDEKAAPLPRAAAVMAEIRNARSWGLDPAAFFLPAPPAVGADEQARAAFDVRLSFAAAKYAAHARGGRVDPSLLSKWLDHKPRPVDVPALVAGLVSAADPAAVLRDLHPRHQGFANLRKAYLGLIDPAAGQTSADPDALPPGPTIAPGQRHPDIAILRRRLGVIGTAHEEDLYDDRLVAAVRAHMKLGRRSAKPAIDARVRDALNNPPELAKTAKSDPIDARKILVNMERWRYLPDDLGELHIWNSLTEFETRVTKGGEVVHQERIIIGKPDTQTPVFSDRMEYLVFQPEWGVPNSIKVKQLLPALQEGNDGILDARGMKILVNGREKDPGDYNWEKTDIRYVPVFQLPGPSNPLGQVKFMFPNKHDVYMHDTPQKALFNDSRRTHSHGCIRVRNPRRLAELIMGLDQGWGEREVADVLGPRSKASNRVDLQRPIPVHNTYFTVFADASGSLRSAADIYNHDKRISDALDGVPVERIAARDPARVLERELEEIAPTGKTDGTSAIIYNTAKQKAAAAARKRQNGYFVDGDYAYLPPSKPKFSSYSGLFGSAPPPPPAYYPPPKKGSYGGPSLYDMVNRSYYRN